MVVDTAVSIELCYSYFGFIYVALLC
jgi:hypothetical protein